MKRWNKNEIEELRILINKGCTYKEIAINIGRTKKAVKLKCSKLHIQYNPIINPTKIKLNCTLCQETFVSRITENRLFCSQSCSATYNNTLKGKKKGVCILCNTHLLLRSHISKYCSIKCSQESHRIKNNNLFLEGKLTGPSAKRHLLMIEKSCKVCGITEWMGKPISLDMDHIDGNYSNNKPENLRLLCPNCHSQTPTYKTKNIGKGRHSRRKRYEDGKSY